MAFATLEHIAAARLAGCGKGERCLRGLGAISPGRVAYLRIDRLPPGPHTLLCFVPDDESGIPHALDGMHKVVPFQ